VVSPVMGRDVCPGWEPDCLKPAGTGGGVSARVYDSNSLGDRAREGRGSERRHAETVEGISARIHAVNSQGTAQIRWERGMTPACWWRPASSSRRQSRWVSEWVCVSRWRGGELRHS